MCKKTLLHGLLSSMLLLSMPQALCAAARPTEKTDTQLSMPSKTMPETKKQKKSPQVKEMGPQKNSMTGSTTEPSKKEASPVSKKAKSMGGVQNMTSSADLKSKIKSGNSVVKFSTKWCGPCKQLAPVFKEIAEAQEFAHITFIAVDVDAAKEIANEQGISSIPVIKYFKNGKEVKRTSGSKSKKELTNNIREVFNK